MDVDLAELELVLSSAPTFSSGPCFWRARTGPVSLCTSQCACSNFAFDEPREIWGYCSRGGRPTISRRLIQLPKQTIESGLKLPTEPYISLPNVGNRRKIVHTFMATGDIDISNFCSNTYIEEWPKGSGIQREFPEADNIGWFSLLEAKNKIHKYLVPVLDYAMDFLP